MAEYHTQDFAMFVSWLASIRQEGMINRPSVARLGKRGWPLISTRTFGKGGVVSDDPISWVVN